MPAPQPAAMKQLVRAKFMSFQLKIPPNWQQPQGDGASQFNGAFKDNELTTQPASPPLFIPATMNVHHTNAQKQAVKDYGDFMDGMVDAICDAWSKWQSTATMTAVSINSMIAAGGQVVGPPLAPLIMAQAPKGKPNFIKYATAIANAFSNAWLMYTSSLKVPGLPWYPAFLMVTLPMAPPTPNVPTPVASLAGSPAPLMANTLSSQMFGMFGDPMAPYAAKLFEAIADGINKMFMIWQTSTMVMNVMGTGPVPTFAPPVVPGGPVVAGIGNMTPGGFK